MTSERVYFMFECVIRTFRNCLINQARSDEYLKKQKSAFSLLALNAYCVAHIFPSLYSQSSSITHFKLDYT